jgi:glycosyltransferase involved in cell wall biosynthesis
MRIWLAPSAFFPHRGGVEELTLKLAQHLIRKGHDVLVVVHMHPLDLPADDTVEGTPVKRIIFPSPGRSPRQIRRFGREHASVQKTLGRLRRPDLINIQCPSNQTLPIAGFATRKRIPLILTSQGEIVMDAAQIYQRSAYMRASLRFAAAQAAALTACSAWTAHEAARFSHRFEKAIPILNGVDPEDWLVGPVPSEPIFCAWGRHVPQKGLDLAIAAFNTLRERLPRARLLVGGDGPERANLESMAGDGVEFLGSLSRAEVREMLGRSRVAIVPSRIEPFGIVALEALATGRALVYSATAGGLREAAGSRGHAVDPSDQQAFAEALERAALDPSDEPANIARAHELSWSAVTDRYLQVYGQMRTRR